MNGKDPAVIPLHVFLVYREIEPAGHRFKWPDILERNVGHIIKGIQDL